MEHSVVAALECWFDAGLVHDAQENNDPHWNIGLCLGTGISAIDVIAEVVAPAVSERQHRRLGSRSVERTMVSGPAAALAGIFGIGGPVITVSSACSSGASAIHRALRELRTGRIEQVLVGGVDILNLYSAAAFDAMKVLNKNHNNCPDKASRPLSATAGGFVPAGGAGFLFLKRAASVANRGARTYCEVVGSYENSGGQRGDGSMTLASGEGIVRCILGAVEDARLSPSEIIM